MSNPKTEPTDNAKKDPDEWLSGDDPMTGAQASYLKTLCEQAGTPEAYDDNLTKAEASKMIDEMPDPICPVTSRDHLISDPVLCLYLSDLHHAVFLNGQ